MNSTASIAAAAKQILGFYDTIPAADQRAFTAGFVEMLSKYPPQVVERAISPSRGLPAFVSYPNLAKFRELLDEWAEIAWEEEVRRRNSRLAKLPPSAGYLPPRRLEAPPQGHFANVHIPATHPRYESLAEWTKTADPKFWIFGKSSVGVDGIWVPLNVWDEGASAMKKIAASATMTVDQLRGHYARHDLGGRPKSGEVA